MHPPYAPGRSQRWKWWWEDLASARFSLGLAVSLVAVVAGLQAGGGVDAVPRVFEWFGLHRSGILEGKIWQLVSHAALHGGWLHVLVNAVLLVLAGARVERIANRVTAAKVFGAGVVAGGLMYLAVPPDPAMILVGSSGGVFALLLWLTTVSPQSRMWPVPLSARSLGLGLILASGALAIAGPWLPMDQPPVAHACHFGGALAGWVMARRLLRKPLSLEDLRRKRARRESANGPRRIG